MNKTLIVAATLITLTAFAGWLSPDSNNAYPNARITALCCSADGKVIYQAIGNDNGGPAILLKSTDSGQTWLKYVGKEIERARDGGWTRMYNLDEPAEAEISALTCSADGKILYVGLDRRGKSYPTLFRTLDGGDNWMAYVGR